MRKVAKKAVKKVAKKNVGGRPSKCREEFCELARNYALLGATDEDLAKFFDVNVATLSRWKKDHPEFCASLKEGKEETDSLVAKKLFLRACGHQAKEDKIFLHEGKAVIVPTVKNYPPDTTAAIFWLKNRQPDKWRDKKEIETINEEEVKKEIAERAKVVSPLIQGRLDAVQQSTKRREQGG